MLTELKQEVSLHMFPTCHRNGYHNTPAVSLENQGLAAKAYCDINL